MNNMPLYTHNHHWSKSDKNHTNEVKKMKGDGEVNIKRTYHIRQKLAEWEVGNLTKKEQYTEILSPGKSEGTEVKWEVTFSVNC